MGNSLQVDVHVPLRGEGCDNETLTGASPQSLSLAPFSVSLLLITSAPLHSSVGELNVLTVGGSFSLQ